MPIRPLTRKTIACVLLMLAASLVLPFTSAHVALETFGSNSYSYSATASCSGSSTLAPSSKTCTETVEVPFGYTHVHSTFVFPWLGLATLSVNLQEETEAVGDFVTYYDRACTTGLVPYTSRSGVTCFGGQFRDWHAGRTHKFRGEGQEPACVPLFCKWVVATRWY